MKSINIKGKIHNNAFYTRMANAVDLQLYGTAGNKMFNILYINLRVHLVNTSINTIIRH